MNHLILASLLMLLPANQEGERRLASADTVPRAAAQPAAADTPVVVQRPRRRGSMVGYIEDPTIATRLRLRFEAGFRNHVPDRAEFFYAKCGCFRFPQPLDSNNPRPDTLALGPGPGQPLYVDFQQLFLLGEVAVSERVSAFVELPIRRVQPNFAEGDDVRFPDATGLSDVRVGLKLGLIAEPEQAVTLQIRGHLASGDPLKGLGTNHNTLEPALLYYQRIAQLLTLEAQGGIWLPFGRSTNLPASADEQFAGAVLYYGLGPSFTVYRTERLQFAPVVELLGWQVLSGYQTPTGEVWGSASGTSIVNLKVGARTSFGTGSIYLGYGRALTEQSWYEEIIRAEYRHTF